MLKYALKCFYTLLFWFRQARDWVFYHAYYWPFVHTPLTRLQLLRLHTSKLGYTSMWVRRWRRLVGGPRG